LSKEQLALFEAAWKAPVGDLQRTYDEIEMGLDSPAPGCAFCGKVTVFPGWSSMMALYVPPAVERFRLSADTTMADLLHALEDGQVEDATIRMAS